MSSAAQSSSSHPPDAAAARLFHPGAAQRAPIDACASGALPANVALMQLMMASRSPNDVSAALAHALQGCPDAAAAARLAAAQSLWDSTPDAWTLVTSLLRCVDHQMQEQTDGAPVRRIAGAFDKAAGLSGDGASALYALGRADLLKAATAELVAAMRRWSLLHREAAVLDLGCGAGRVLEQIARDVRIAVGLDVSAAMLQRARRCCRDLPNAHLACVSGEALDAIADAQFDLVCAIDVFPYLYLAGQEIVVKTLRDIARALKPGGALLLINFSYRGDLDADRSDVARMAASCSLELILDGVREFSLWDGRTWLLKRPTPASDRPRHERI